MSGLHNVFIRSIIFFIPHLGVSELVSKTSSIIEINGNRYDAVSGRLLGAAKKAAYHIKTPISNLTIDGFTKPAKAIRRSAVKRSIHTMRRKPEHSKTLMRSVVKKPARARPDDKIQSHTLSPDYARASRAANVTQNSKVQRFGLLSFSRGSEAKSGEVITAQKTTKSHRSAALSVGLPAVITNSSHHKLERLLDYALAHADAHKKSLDKSARDKRKLFGRIPKWLAIGLVLLVAAGVVGFIVWRKVPQASLKLAATKAGVNASLPAPISGYKIGPITSAENAVITTVQSITDSSKKYTVTEKLSNQPATSLAAATASKATASTQVQTVQDADKTYVLSQDEDKSTAACTKGSNTISVEGVGLNVAQLLEAAKNACD